MNETALRLPGGHLPIVGTLLDRFTMGVSAASNIRLSPEEIEDAIDIREAQMALLDPAPSIPLDEVLARYAAELGDIGVDDDW
jgi:hypothetical protein